jgi:hypothetical protein
VERLKPEMWQTPPDPNGLGDRQGLDLFGWGWKAATIDALHPAACLLAPIAPLAVLLMNARSLYRAPWPAIQRTPKVREAQVEAEMTAWHTYVLEWGRDRARFCADDDVVLPGAPSPRRPLGFVLCVDNQYFVARPWGRYRWGLLEVPGRQWLEVGQLDIEPPSPKESPGL